MLVPKVLIQFTRKRVLTMEWVDGENPKDLLSLSKGVSKKILKLQISRS
jgi:predicted unusual protein kinase regulating ubiquinone biosynthesis (AarF/ABC1/UbiB family)